MMDEVAKAIGELTAEVRNAGARIERLELAVNGKHEALEEKHQAVETRVRNLELWRSWTAGAGAVLAAAVGWLFSK